MRISLVRIRFHFKANLKRPIEFSHKPIYVLKGYRDTKHALQVLILILDYKSII